MNFQGRVKESTPYDLWTLNFPKDFRDVYWNAGRMSYGVWTFLGKRGKPPMAGARGFSFTSLLRHKTLLRSVLNDITYGFILLFFFFFYPLRSPGPEQMEPDSPPVNSPVYIIFLFEKVYRQYTPIGRYNLSIRLIKHKILLLHVKMEKQTSKLTEAFGTRSKFTPMKRRFFPAQ